MLDYITLYNIIITIINTTMNIIMSFEFAPR